MRLVLVHGINQQGKSSEAIREEWLEAMRAGAKQTSAWPANRVTEVVAPFYGKVLFEHTEREEESDTIAQGIEDSDGAFVEFAEQPLLEMAKALGATEQAILDQSDLDAVPQGDGIHKPWVKAIARFIETVSPFKGEIAVRLLKQAHVYLSNKAAAKAVDDIVRPALTSDEPTVIVAHSLGTIVTYKLLREFHELNKPRTAPLYLTLGSPLGIEVVRQEFRKPRIRPANVTRWLNGADPDDFVALRAPLNGATFGTGIEDIVDIENGEADPHAITDYLRDLRIGEAIRGSLG